VIHAPFSRFTDIIRSIKVAADMSTSADDSCVIGVVSALPGEGKSTVAANLAQLLTNTEHRALLIDGDLRRPFLTEHMSPNATAGLLQVLDGSITATDVIWEDPITKLHFIPAVLEKPIAHTADLISSTRMKMLVESMRTRYKYVVFDLPALNCVIDAKAVSDLIDKFLLVIKWGETPLEAVTQALNAAEVIQARLLGAVLNEASLTVLKRLEPYKAIEYYDQYKSA